MKARRKKRSEDGTLLKSMAESIGSTLGAIAAKAHAAQKALTHSSVTHTVQRDGRKLLRKGKAAARRAGNAVAKLKKNKIAKAARHRVRRVGSSNRRAFRRNAPKARPPRRRRARVA